MTRARLTYGVLPSSLCVWSSVDSHGRSRMPRPTLVSGHLSMRTRSYVRNRRPELPHHLRTAQHLTGLIRHQEHNRQDHMNPYLHPPIRVTLPHWSVPTVHPNPVAMCPLPVPSLVSAHLRQSLFERVSKPTVHSALTHPTSRVFLMTPVMVSHCPSLVRGMPDLAPSRWPPFLSFRMSSYSTQIVLSSLIRPSKCSRVRRVRPSLFHPHQRSVQHINRSTHTWVPAVRRGRHLLSTNPQRIYWHPYRSQPELEPPPSTGRYSRGYQRLVLLLPQLRNRKRVSNPKVMGEHRIASRRSLLLHRWRGHLHTVPVRTAQHQWQLTTAALAVRNPSSSSFRARRDRPSVACCMSSRTRAVPSQTFSRVGGRLQPCFAGATVTAMVHHHR